MRDAILHDLVALPDITVVMTHDTRVPVEPPVGWVAAEREIWPQWDTLMSGCTAAWIIAPETGGVLARLTHMAEQHGVAVLSASTETIALGENKWRMYHALTQAHIATIPTYLSPEALIQDEPHGPWVMKPVDGAGCEHTWCFDQPAPLEAQAKNLSYGVSSEFIFQPWRSGIPASLSMVCGHGQALLLSANQQQIAVNQNRIQYSGSVVNGLAQHWTLFEQLAQRLIAAFPFLHGYLGVDVLLHDDALTVVEINPRATTSYVGLNASLGVNTTKTVIDFLYNGRMKEQQQFTRRPVVLRVD